ncbi:MAG: helix-turn-helix domain-containing protein, partial [Dehalococcoidia bacterium]
DCASTRESQPRLPYVAACGQRRGCPDLHKWNIDTTTPDGKLIFHIFGALAMAQSLYHNTKTPIDDICRQFNISRPTLYRYVGTKRTAAVSAETEA